MSELIRKILAQGFEVRIREDGKLLFVQAFQDGKHEGTLAIEWDRVIRKTGCFEWLLPSAEVSEELPSFEVASALAEFGEPETN